MKKVITPLMLAVTPVTVQLQEIDFKYDHEVQQNQSVDVAQYQPPRMPTISGTRTYDVQGRPWDSDND